MLVLFLVCTAAVIPVEAIAVHYLHQQSTDDMIGGFMLVLVGDSLIMSDMTVGGESVHAER
jgi:hypothetical protein